MNRILTPAALLLLLVALPLTVLAQKQAKDKLVGTWTAKLEVDDAKAKKLFKEQGVPDEQAALALGLIKGQFSKISFVAVFKDDGTMTMEAKGGPGAQEESLKWEVISEKDGKVELKTTNEKKDESQSVTIEFKGDDKFTLTMKELDAAPVKTPEFSRQKDKAEQDDDK